MLDFIDYKLNKTSILAYFYSHKHRHSFYLFFLTSFIFCFIVDYLWGVKVFKIWQWKNYGLIQFVRMYLFTNASFMLGMYELYRVTKTLLKTSIAEKSILHLRIPSEKRGTVYICMLILGIIFLILPVCMLIFNIYSFKEFIMLLSFVSMIFITDAITYLTGGKPILEDIIHLNLLKITSLMTTIFVAIVVTEGLNMFGKEWVYLQMPFNNFQIFNIPVVVIVGWIPLVIGTICLVNMIKHLDYIYFKKANIETVRSRPPAGETGMKLF